MTNTKSKSAAIAETIKKNAKVLLSGKKDVKRLAAALPLTALLVEEVRAAQKTGVDVVVVSEPDEAQDPALGLATDSQDSPQDQVSDVWADERVSALPDGEGSPEAVDGGDVLLAQADTTSPAGGATISDAGASALSGAEAAVAAETFELSGLPLLLSAGLAPVPAALGFVAVAVTNNILTGESAKSFNVTQAQAADVLANNQSFASSDSVTLNLNDEKLSLSLKQLQKIGIDAVSVAGVTSDLSVDLGTGSALAAGALPVFGDSDNNGTLSVAEDAALNVSLNVDSLAQIKELSSVSEGLSTSGIDNVSLHLADQTALDAVFADTGFGTSFDSLIAAGLSTSIDMSNNLASLNAVQANNLIAEGLHFASNDFVDLQMHAATGTHLSTSLKDLQKLGVDAVGIGGAAGDAAIQGISLDLGTGSGPFNTSGLPTFGDSNRDGTLSAAEDAALNVTLDVANLGQLHDVAGVSGLAALGIDDVSLNFTNQAAFDTAFASGSSMLADLSALHTAGLNTSTIDMAGSFINAQIHLTELQAATLNTQGLHFAANDFVAMDVTAAQATHLNTSMADLRKLGVDTLTITDGELITDLGVMANSLTSHGITHLGLSSSDLANTTLTAGTTLAQKVGNFDWAQSGIDFTLDVDSNVSNFMRDLENGIDFFNNQQLSATAKWGDLMGALHQSGLGNINLQSSATNSSTSTNVVVSDELTGALYDAGMLHALPDANITLDVGTNKVLQTSLKAMLDIGVDSVQTDHKVYVDLGLDQATAHDMQGLFASFNYDTTVPAGGLFGGKEAGLVVDETTFKTMGASDVHTLVQQLSKLGITEIDVLSSSHVVTHAYQITAQTQVLSQVDILGTSSTASADVGVFDTDILQKTIKS